MSREDVAVVRSYNEPYDGRDVAAYVRSLAAEDEPGALESAAQARILEEPITQHLHPDVVWDVSGTGATFFGSVRGLDELARYWVEWAAVWESYVYEVTEYRDLGDWVLTAADTRVRSKEGMDLDMRVFQVWRVSDGKIAEMRAFLSEEEALEAVAAAR